MVKKLDDNEEYDWEFKGGDEDDDEDDEDWEEEDEEELDFYS